MTCGDRKADYEQKSEPVLIFESLAGDQKASEEIVRRYHGRLLYYIRRILGTSADAEDVLQDVWLGIPNCQKPGHSDSSKEKTDLALR